MKTCRKGLHQYEGKRCPECRKASNNEYSRSERGTNTRRRLSRKYKHSAKGKARQASSQAAYRRSHPLYNIWCGIKQRCFNANSKCYNYYGGRGITVCDRWRASYEDFVADVGERPSLKHTLDRVDGDGNYEPGNVRWATPHEQRVNRSTNMQLKQAA